MRHVGSIVNYSPYRMPDARGPLDYFYYVGRVTGEFAPGYAKVQQIGTTYYEGSSHIPRPHSILTAFYFGDVVDNDRMFPVEE